ncbi:MAG: hypothetical protein ACRC0V_04990 [Fusobacteriaceae bacterium]
MNLVFSLSDKERGKSFDGLPSIDFGASPDSFLPEFDWRVKSGEVSIPINFSTLSGYFEMNRDATVPQ